VTIRPQQTEAPTSAPTPTPTTPHPTTRPTAGIPSAHEIISLGSSFSKLRREKLALSRKVKAGEDQLSKLQAQLKEREEVSAAASTASAWEEPVAARDRTTASQRAYGGLMPMPKKKGCGTEPQLASCPGLAINGNFRVALSTAAGADPLLAAAAHHLVKRIALLTGLPLDQARTDTKLCAGDGDPRYVTRI